MSKPVTPYVGVWIETRSRVLQPKRLKVTPYVGVWIETILLPLTSVAISVTPYVGVWIETEANRVIKQAESSHTLRGCVD